VQQTEALAEWNRAALKLLLEAAQAISDGELDHARRLQRHASRRLSSRWNWRLAEIERLIAFLGGGQPRADGVLAEDGSSVSPEPRRPPTGSMT